MLEQRKKLPAWNEKEKILDLLDECQVLVISGMTGWVLWFVGETDAQRSLLLIGTLLHTCCNLDVIVVSACGAIFK